MPERSNIGLRLAVCDGTISADYALDGPQHAEFSDTIPAKVTPD